MFNEYIISPVFHSIAGIAAHPFMIIPSCLEVPAGTLCRDPLELQKKIMYVCYAFYGLQLIIGEFYTVITNKNVHSLLNVKDFKNLFAYLYMHVDRIKGYIMKT